MAKYGIKGRALGYAACDDEMWPISNADRIRAMSDEELALWIISTRSIPICHQCKNRTDSSGTTCYRNGEEWCKYGIMDWLKQEVE